MSNSYKLTGSKRNAIYEVRDALVLGCNSLSPNEIKGLGKRLDEILGSLSNDVSEKWLSDSHEQRKKVAISVGLLCQGIEDLVTAGTKEACEEGSEIEQGTGRTRDASAYAGDLQEEGERTIKSLGFAKEDIRAMSFY